MTDYQSAITHCDNCGCDWLDNGLNPIGCPYCKLTAQTAEIEALRAEVERLKSMTAVTMGVGSGDGKLFVHGDYDSIKAAQAIVLERDALRAEVELWRHRAATHKSRRERLAEALREAYGQVRELCGCYGLAYPATSFARYEALLRDEEGR